MPDVDFYYDGTRLATIAGPPEYQRPFPFDPTPYIYHVPYWLGVELLNQEPGFGTAGPFGGSYAGIVGKSKPIGGGIVEITREYAFVPVTRSEYESFVYPFQVWATGASGGVQEFPFSVNSRLQFDYFQTDAPASIDLPRAPRIIDAFNVLFPLNGFNVSGFTDQPNFLAEDASLKRWKGNIYERRQRFIYLPSVYSFLFSQ